MDKHEKLRELTAFQYWLGSNYTTLPTGSVDMTDRAIEYVRHLEQEKLLSVEFLMQTHPELSSQEASSLLQFCKDSTINLKGCYGDGGIMYPKWKNKMSSTNQVVESGID